jgi:hypothetical protein
MPLKDAGAGFSSSTALNMIVLPVLYRRFGRPVGP